MKTNKNEVHTYLEYVEEAVVKYDINGCLQYYNSKFKDLYSYTDSDLRLGVHFSELGKIDLQNGNVVTPEFLGAKQEYLALKAKYRSNLNGSFTVQLKDGRFIKTTDRLLPDGGFISVQTDVTELEGSLRALEAKNLRPKVPVLKPKPGFRFWNAALPQLCCETVALLSGTHLMAGRS